MWFPTTHGSTLPLEVASVPNRATSQTTAGVVLHVSGTTGVLMHVFSEVENPEQPGGTPWTGAQGSGQKPQAYKQDLSSLMPKAEGEPLLIPYDINGLAAGNSITFECESGIPEYWHVSIRPVANSRVSCFNGPENSGVPYRLGGGGTLKVRAKSEFFTILSEVGGAAIVGTIVACRKMEFDMSGGAI